MLLISLLQAKWLKYFLPPFTYNFNEDSGNVVFTCNWMSILNIDLNDISLDDTNYDEDNPDAIILVRLFAWHIWIFLSDFIGQNISKYLNYFSIKNYTWKLDIVQNLYKFWAQNISIPPRGKMFQYPQNKICPREGGEGEGGCFNSPTLYTTQIFHKFFISCDFFHDLLGKWNNNKMWNLENIC